MQCRQRSDHRCLDAGGVRCAADHERAGLERTSIVERVFGGLLRSDVTCCACGYTSTAYDPFLDISLDMRCAALPDNILSLLQLKP